MTRKLAAALLCLGATLGASPALARQQAPSSAPMAPSSTPSPSTPWVAENAASMDRMHDAMMESAGGTSEDEAFVRGMLPHHQGAIDMARTELRYGHDPMLKRLAARIVATQTTEIQEMSGWIARHR